MDFLSLLPEEIDVLPDYRKDQIFSWLHRHKARSFGEMTNLSKALRAGLAERYTIGVPREVERQASSDGTQKILWEFSDGEHAETVLMRYNHGVSACLSTQAGCRQGCAFCASGTHGFSRNLTAGEILGQIYNSGEDINRVVLMGTGEPLDNFDQVVRFIRLIGHPMGRNLSPRHISLSTCGDVPGILRLAETGLPVTLSISLHAPDDETRDRLMPINRKYPISMLLDAAGKYFAKTGRRISYEYVIMDGLNDTLGHARRLKTLLKGKPAHINIIPCNPVPDKTFAPPKAESVKKFLRELDGLEVTVRRTLGSDIDAACGQLRSRRC
jgi:23S rRNA (adenine2503-C2)-methyltransferase